MRWAEDVARIREKMNAYRILVGKLGVKRPLERPKHLWENNNNNNNNTDLRKIGRGFTD
jgi:hypothetical protein